MKSLRFSIFFMLFLVSTFYLPSTFAQDYTQFHLPEGAKVRLGKGSIQKLAYSPDGMRLAVVSSIGIWLYDAQTGEELSLLPGDVSDVAFSPDGQTLASGVEEKSVCGMQRLALPCERSQSIERVIVLCLVHVGRRSQVGIQVLTLPSACGIQRQALPCEHSLGIQGASVALYSVRMGGCLRVEVGWHGTFVGPSVGITTT